MREVRLLTLNFLQKPVFISSSVPDEFKAERVELFAREFARFDVVCFQEIFEFWNPRAGRLVELAAAAGFPFFAKSPVCPYASEFMLSAGLLTVSRLPISDSRFVAFSPCIHGDKFIQKGVLWCQVELPSGARLQVFNTHALAYFSYLDHPTKVVGHVERARQFLAIKRLAKEVLAGRRGGDLAVLCGDFNVNGRNHAFPFDEVAALLDLPDGEADRLRTSHEFEFYRRVLEWRNPVFRARNLYFDQHGEYPVTNGLSVPDPDGRQVPTETLITDPMDRFDNSCLDYVLLLEDAAGRPGEGRAGPGAVPGSARVERFLVDHSFLTQLSDHFGISVTLRG